MSIVLFAILGALTKAGAGYWICFGFYCLFDLIRCIAKIAKSDDNGWGG